MGVTGLLPQLKPIQNQVTLRRYEGTTLGIDGYAWLHRAACSCAYELAMDLPTEKYLKFFIKRFNMLKSFGVEPYLVFDGDSINVKSETNAKRREKRHANKELAMKLWNSGNRRNAMDYFQKCVDITPEMAKCVIDYCKNNGIKYVVAPFEADPQMVYLEKIGVIQGIISEDSDLLIFGCRRLITKLNDYGECIEICRDDFKKIPSKFPIGQLNDSEIRMMVCLSGCDYTSGIPRIGLIKAIKLVSTHRNMERIILALQHEGKITVPEDFFEEYQFADLSFQFQRVFCPVDSKIVTLNEVPENLLSNELLYKCIGNLVCISDGEKRLCKDHEIDNNVHFQLARGDLNPYDHRKRLVNREHKLQLYSKSDMSLRKSSNGGINEVSRDPPLIDSYFTNKSKVNSFTGSTSNKDKKVVYRDPIENKFEVLMSKRKLAKAQTTSMVKSKFFNFTKKSVIVEQDQREIASKETSVDADDVVDITQDSSDTELPDSELPTQISENVDLIGSDTGFTVSDKHVFQSSDIASQRDEIGNHSEEMDEIIEVFSEDEEPKSSPLDNQKGFAEEFSNLETNSRTENKDLHSSHNLLNSFKYSSETKREPLKAFSINKTNSHTIDKKRSSSGFLTKVSKPLALSSRTRISKNKESSVSSLFQKNSSYSEHSVAKSIEASADIHSKNDKIRYLSQFVYDSTSNKSSSS